MLDRRRLLLVLGSLAMLVLLGCAGTKQRESTGEYFDDTAITTRVNAAILKEPTLKFFQIEVETFKGRVLLSGFVDTKEQMATAGRVASGCKGVKTVVNHLVVK
ncbi:BON domain-containing protein [Desulfovibrio aminophilus]|nr:BON domain-containing protein [Desulfovibrio aminophilus]MCM0754401.1 BON domain-containing protein [Desulfovibrio aminophilus]